MAAQGADAATIYQQTGGKFEGAVIPAYAMAVDDATGDVISGSVEEATGLAGAGLAIYTPEGSGVTYLETVSGPAIGYVSGLAIDQATRSLYLTETGVEAIRKFSISGTSTLTLTPDPSFTSPAQGSQQGQIGSFGSPMTIDPTTGDLLVADKGNRRVDRFAPDGSFISSFDGSDATAGPFSQLNGIAVGLNGQIYVVNGIELSFGNEAPLERFSPAGVADNSFEPAIPVAEDVVTDPESGNVVAYGRSGEFGSPGAIYSLSGDSIIQEEVLPSTRAESPQMAIGAHRLYLLAQNQDGSEAQYIYNGVVGADVTVAGVTGIGPTSATISGTIEPHGKETDYWVEYSRESGPSQKSAEAPAGESEGSVPVSVQLSGLLPNSEYTFRLIAKNPDVSRSSEPMTFKTAGAPPRVSTGGASNASTSSAKLLGAINALGSQTTYFFEYGPTTSYGARVPAQAPGLAGAGREELTVSQEVVGLQAGSEYHYRLVAENAFGLTHGQDRSFTIQAAGPPTRVFELVTPDEKGNSFANPYFMHATPSGNQVTYVMQTAIPGMGESAPKLDRYTSLRSPTAWQTIGLEPHNVQVGLGDVSFANVLGVSEDGSRAVVASTALLAPGGDEGGTNLYLYNIGSGTYQTILANPSPAAFKKWTTLQGKNPGVFLGGSRNFSHIYFQTAAAPPQEVVEGVLLPSSFEWSESNGLRVVAENTFDLSYFTGSNPHYISEDGLTLFYESFEDFHLHAQVRGQDFPISPEFAEFAGASADGSLAFYVENEALYRYNVVTKQRETVATGVSEAALVWGVSNDGSTVYFIENGNGGLGGGLFVWRSGSVQKIDSDRALPVNREASPNGSYAVFGSTLDLTGYNNEGFEEVYRYDVANEELSCASCRTDGGKPSGSASIGELDSPFEPYKPRAILDSGLTLFDTPDQLVAADVNSNSDVYAFDGRNQTLISSGAGSTDSFFGDASESGDDIFFTTSDRLVKGDTNNDVDVYDARVGGGIASQQVEPEGPTCSGAGCRPSGASPPDLGPMPSEGPGGQTASKQRHHHQKKKSTPSKTCHRSAKKGKQGKRQCTKAKDHSQRGQGR